MMMTTTSSSGDLVNVICAACKLAAPVSDVCRAVASLIPSTDPGRARVALALRQAADRLLVDDLEVESETPFALLLNLSIELSKANLCGFNVPFVLIEDLLISRTVGELASVFDLVEHYVDILAQSKLIQSQKAKLSLLRICNSLLGRLPKTQDMALRGKVLILLARCFPLDERSGVNLKASFNTTNVTIMDSEVPSSASSPHLDFAFYRTFWSLQSFLCNPRLLADESAQADLMRIVDAVVTAFEGNPLTAMDVEAAKDVGNDGFNAKFLTTPRLFPLQLRDPELRRTILLQLIILFDFVLQSSGSSKVPITLTAQRRSELTALYDRINQSMESTPHDGRQFLASLKTHLTSEVLWSNWKDAGCPPIENKLIEREPISEEPLHIIAPELISMGVPALNRSWKVSVALSDSSRTFDTSSRSILQDIRDEDDPEADIEETYKKKNDLKWCWKALRILMRNDLQSLCEFEGDLVKMAQKLAPSSSQPQSTATMTTTPHRTSSPSPAQTLEVPIAPEICISVETSRLSVVESTRAVTPRTLIKRRITPTAAVDSHSAELEDGALEETPTKRIRTASSMNEQLQEQIALERAKKQQQDEEIRARRATRFERKAAEFKVYRK